MKTVRKCAGVQTTEVPLPLNHIGMFSPGQWLVFSRACPRAPEGASRSKSGSKPDSRGTAAHSSRAETGTGLLQREANNYLWKSEHARPQILRLGFPATAPGLDVSPQVQTEYPTSGQAGHVRPSQ